MIVIDVRVLMLMLVIVLMLVTVPVLVPVPLRLLVRWCCNVVLHSAHAYCDSGSAAVRDHDRDRAARTCARACVCA